MDRQLLKRLNHSVEHYACIGEDGRGDRVFASVPVTRSCYREGKMSIVKSVDGEERTSKLKLYFDGLFPITSKDKMIFNGESYPVLAYEQYDGLVPGTGTTVVYL